MTLATRPCTVQMKGLDISEFRHIDGEEEPPPPPPPYARAAWDGVYHEGQDQCPPCIRYSRQEID